VYRKMNPTATEARLVQVGRISTVILIVAGLAWIPFMKYISPQIYIYLQSVQAYIAPPIAACFLFGVLNSRLNGTGAMWALISGLVLGTLRLLLELNKAHLGDTGFLHWYASINFLHFAVLLFVICTALLVAVSYATKPPAPENVADLTYHTADQVAVSDETPASRRVNMMLSVLLAAVIGVLWIVFR